ncbi:Bifunctional ribokinase/ribose-5-phosphate isomerase A [Neomoorella glycerini]|uniref:Bifunctional ribokinase/ribose-5-phosphate isomerase A n=1 Tax=Neomoorella glycerini TaxID=55779 RepID=A0A6I5ZW30_9FIRM|nr:Bifunctional ribokinase/ribose-5-phosphate isomerase A [Moorella glycerini]
MIGAESQQLEGTRYNNQPGEPTLPYSVVTVGAAAVDLVAQVDTFPGADQLVLAREVRREPGGSTANIAVRLAQLGERVAFAGLVGDDASGQYLKQAFASEGVATELITTVTNGNTASAVVMVNPEGQRAILSLGGTALYSEIAQVPAGVWESKLLYIGEAYLPLVRQLVNGACSRDQQVFYGPGGIFVREGWAALAEASRGIKGLFLNWEECMLLLGQEARVPSQLPALAEWLALVIKEAGWWQGALEEIVVTLGARGCIWLAPDDLSWQPAMPGRVVDTTGAGDAFTAGYLAAYLKGWPVQTRLKFATACASLAIEGQGPRSGQLTLERVTTRLQLEGGMAGG